MKMKMKNNRVVDLFCGCSGLGLGARQAGFEVALSIDIDSILTSSHSKNFPGESVHLGDVASMSGSELKKLSGGQINGIVGGPPCQGFSSMGKSDPSDVRRSLLGHFFRLISEVEPDFFLMENVKGLLDRRNVGELEAALDQVRDRYSIAGPHVFNAKDFGAATNRPRVFVLGLKNGGTKHLLSCIESRKKPATSVRDAIEDLIGAELISNRKSEIDWWRIKDCIRFSEYSKSMRTKDGITSGLRTVPHKDEVAQRFASVLPGKVDKIGRHYRLDWDGQCPTLRAGTGPDKGSFQSVRPLHPELPRVINVREAARLQGFPDWFQFHRASWHSFRMIGNSVSPIISRELFLSLIDARISICDPQPSWSPCAYTAPIEIKAN
ncbi:hypothetical protein AL035_15665 [Salipiger aestuarii]|nr:DNA cytosine methyltransferase [Salipiger aestuarii]KAB2540811.1 hypothetical protein AL035_15665 [Salipiger aestuarii]